MFGSTILDVAVGLTLVFLSVSLICTAIREFIEALLKSRAMDLERGLRELLGNPAEATKLFGHPLIKSLYGGTYGEDKLKRVKGWLSGSGDGQAMRIGARRSLPSYIPASQFAVAMLDLLTDGKLAPQPAAPPPPPAAGAAPVVPPEVTMDSLRTAAAAIESDGIKRAMMSAIDMADGEIAKVRTNLENWFNGTMDRVSGWYKRRTQFILFAIGLIAAILLNVDAITIATRLGSDEDLRRAVVASAATIVQDAQPTTPSGAAVTVDDEAKYVAKLKANLEAIGVPIGWKDGLPAPQWRPDCEKGTANCPPAFDPLSPLNAQILLGWLITAFAVTLGAPFWFDLLNMFMKLRGTIKPDEKKTS